MNINFRELSDELEELVARRDYHAELAVNEKANVEDVVLPEDYEHFPLTYHDDERLKELLELQADMGGDLFDHRNTQAIHEDDWDDYAERALKQYYTIPHELENYIDLKSWAFDYRYGYSTVEWEDNKYYYLAD